MESKSFHLENHFRYTVTPFSPMALSNLNNPYSPQPSTPVGSTSGEEVFNMNNSYMMDTSLSVVTSVEELQTNQHGMVMDDRSRHSSAESDPNLVKSAPMSPNHHQYHNYHPMPQNNSYVEIGGQRLRHQSAGDQPNPALASLKPPDWIQDPTSLNFDSSQELQDVMFDHRRSQSVPIVEIPPNVSQDYLPTSLLGNF